jgi:membrane fusion protein, protease secretion system
MPSSNKNNSAGPAAGQVSDVVDKMANADDYQNVGRLGLKVLALGLGGFFLFAAFVPLDEGVPTQGVVAIDTKRKAVQHLQGGIVKEVFVREGQWVEQDQPLLRLGDSTVRAGFEPARQQYFSLKAVEARLRAEQLDHKTIAFDPSLVDAAAVDQKLSQSMADQLQLLQTRRSALQATLGSLRESARGQQSIVDSCALIDAQRRRQLISLEADVKGMQDLVRDEYAPKARLNELERQLAETRSQIADNFSNQLRAKQAILEIRQREISTRAEYLRDVEQQLSQIRPEIVSQTERFKAATEDLKNTEIRSPAPGQVVGLQVQSVGGVVQPGQRIMDIVPRDELLILETRIPTHLIDRIKTGDAVDVRFATFSDTPQLVVDGLLQTISSDVILDPNSSGSTPPYYLARVAVTKDGLAALGQRKMQSGMPVEVVIKTGSRTLLSYLVHPLVKRIAASMKEK